jgi:hypothetical protein
MQIAKAYAKIDHDILQNLWQEAEYRCYITRAILTFTLNFIIFS